MVDDMSAEDMPGEMTDGFHLVVEALKLNRVDTIYGVAGIPITDLLRLAQAEGIRYFGFRHEQSAGISAAIAGFLTQKPGICMTVSAPGFLNRLVALANATPTCFPMSMISGSSARAIVDLEQGDYEDLDQLNAARPYAKAAYRINRPQDIGIGIARAIRAAVSGRPACHSCRCRWPRACCPTSIRNRPPPPAPTRSATPMSCCWPAPASTGSCRT